MQFRETAPIPLVDLKNNDLLIMTALFSLCFCISLVSVYIVCIISSRGLIIPCSFKETLQLNRQNGLTLREKYIMYYMGIISSLNSSSGFGS